ncbi:hypothetical protein CEXT_269261 [Caerostris extrusa]|uniref:Uncharacterized protein n=1 Tax=Caerostris extrusa TaxID=172846 RepID=A0AAV4MYX9_CAEEX|nr:hypothetical protein CEXT_269261 [Caerostris extrusa]
MLWFCQTASHRYRRVTVSGNFFAKVAARMRGLGFTMQRAAVPFENEWSGNMAMLGKCQQPSHLVITAITLLEEAFNFHFSRDGIITVSASLWHPPTRACQMKASQADEACRVPECTTGGVRPDTEGPRKLEKLFAISRQKEIRMWCPINIRRFFRA